MKNKNLTRREIQNSEKDILKSVVSFLDSNHLRYSLCGGTLLGAIRHKGFIPWDDDIDIFMPRPDYDRLLTIVKKNKTIDRYSVHAVELKNLNLPFIKIYDQNIRTDDGTFDDKYEKHLWIDIFPIDGLPENDDECARLFKRRNSYKRILFLRKRTNKAILERNSLPKAFLKIAIKFIINLLPANLWAKKISNLTKKYPYKTNDTVGCLVWGYGPQERMSKADVEQYAKVDFEGLKLNGLKKYDEYLTNLYGDYMKLPPKEKRITHSFKAWHTTKNTNNPIKSRALLNVAASILLQITTIICGFIIPRIILKTFGSEVNGLVASLGQFLSYMALVEGGLGGVVAANLYKPLATKNREKLSSVYQTTRNFYKKISYLFLLYTFAVAILYPLLIKTPFSASYIFYLTLILSVTLFTQYNFSISARLLLQADKKVYLVSFAQIFLTIANTIAFALTASFLQNIHVLKLITAAVFLLQPFIFNYFLKPYKLEKSAKPDQKLLKNRWSGFSINIAAFIHNNTDVAVLTILSTLDTVSIYSIYVLITNGLRKILQSISAGIAPSIGHLYARDDRKTLAKKFDIYESLTLAITFFLFSLGALLIVPFVKFYTSGITDANYDQPLFALILILAEFVYCAREPYVALAYSADRFRDIKPHAYIEAILNLIISALLVWRLGLIGVAIGTLIAMLYRTIYQIIYLKNHILHRSLLIPAAKFLKLSLLTALGLFLSIFLYPFSSYSFLDLALHALAYSVILALCLSPFAIRLLTKLKK